MSMSVKSDATSYTVFVDDSAISGYLHKKTREGKWQKRWFETNGIYLTYYKSKKMEKLLAALSLPQIGEIKTVPIDMDPDRLGGLFTLELNTRIYTLRAKNDEEATIWVSTLNKVRQQGIISGPSADTRKSEVFEISNSASDTSTSTAASVAATAAVNSQPPERKQEAETDWLKVRKRYCCGCF